MLNINLVKDELTTNEEMKDVRITTVYNKDWASVSYFIVEAVWGISKTAIKILKTCIKIELLLFYN